jgi:hypothetical protein
MWFTLWKERIINICKPEMGNRINSKGVKIGLTVRNYVEKGKMATTLLAEKFKQ